MSNIAQAPRQGKGKGKAARKGQSAGSRIKRATEEVRAAEKKEPLRRRILEALVESAATPKALSEIVDARMESVSRLLKEFSEGGLVEIATDPGDGRRKQYSLTAEGEVQLNRHRAYGARQAAAPDLDKEETILFLRKALERAVEMRRRSNELGESTDRFVAVLREAEKIEAPDLALEAMAELTKTLRQNREDDKAEEVIDRLNAISLGTEPGYDGSLALPAAAHFRYALGRLGERRGDSLPVRAEHLKTAFSIYDQLARRSSSEMTGTWTCRRAWSLMALATNHRKQTQPERALLYALAAKQGFDEFEDDYGVASCWFVFGFCLRLLGEFHEALTCFDRAYEIADHASYDRLRADTLLQMGDAQRYLGNVDDARVLLNEALARADRMDLMIIQAFAYSALGAVEFQESSFKGAESFLGQAQDIFDDCGHPQGKALTNRRRVTAARQLAGKSGAPSYASMAIWIASASAGYSDLRSPAGIAACQIEDGWVQMKRKKGRVAPVVESLNGLLQDRVSRKIIELDPWVPFLLDRFARETEDKSLQKAARRIRQDARAVLAERARHSLGQLRAVVGDIELVDEGPSDPMIAEMGGETRRNMAPVEEEQILGLEMRPGVGSVAPQPMNA